MDGQQTNAFVTPIHNVGFEHTVKHVRKAPRLTYSNGKRVGEMFGKYSTNRLAIHSVSDKYNFKMIEVHIVDQLRAVHTCHMPRRKVWLFSFSLLFDITV